MAQKLTPAQRTESLDLLDLSFRSGSKPELRYKMDTTKGVKIKDMKQPYASFGPMDDVVMHNGSTLKSVRCYLFVQLHLWKINLCP